MSEVLVAPSILSADFSCLRTQIDELDPVVDMWHLDIMDGMFVPNISFGPNIVRVMRGLSSKPLDVHLMISRPLFFCDVFLDAGANLLTAHFEAFENEREIEDFINRVRLSGTKVGLAIKPSTGLDVIFPFIDRLDLVLIMTVEPGFGGQAFMEDQVGKILALRDRFDGLIAVDGGINNVTGSLCVKNGANLLVSGTFVLSSGNPQEKVLQLKRG